MLTVKQRFERAKEQMRRDAEIMEANAILRAYPELTYGEALRHACAKLRKTYNQQSKGK